MRSLILATTALVLDSAVAGAERPDSSVLAGDLATAPLHVLHVQWRDHGLIASTHGRAALVGPDGLSALVPARR